MRHCGQRRKGSAWTRFAFAGLVLLLCGWADAQIQTYRVPRTTIQPKLDGALDDACWANACVVEGFHLLRAPAGAAELPPTRAFLVYDADSLHIAFRCAEPLADRISARTTRRDGAVWTDDSVEIFLDPAGRREQFLQIAINAGGVVMDGFCSTPGKPLDLAYEAGIQVQTLIGKAEWVVEATLPFTRLPLTALHGPWTIHLARNRATAGQHLTSLRSPISGFHEIARFDVLEGIDLLDRAVCVTDVNLGEMFAGLNLCRATVRNWSDRPVTASLAVGLAGAAAPEREEREIALAAGESRAVEIPWNLPAVTTARPVTLTLRTAGRLLHERAVSVSGTPPLIGTPDRRVFLFCAHQFVPLVVPINLAEGSRHNAHLRWQALAADGATVGAGLTVLREPRAVLRLYWTGWREGRYTLRLSLLCNDTTIATADETIRLVMNPWGH